MVVGVGGEAARVHANVYARVHRVGPGRRYATSHDEERAAVTHNDRLSEPIECGRLTLLYNVCG